MSSPFLLRRSKRCHIGRRLVASLFLRAIVAAFVESAALHLHGALACKQHAPLVLVARFMLARFMLARLSILPFWYVGIIVRQLRAKASRRAKRKSTKTDTTITMVHHNHATKYRKRYWSLMLSYKAIPSY